MRDRLKQRLGKIESYERVKACAENEANIQGLVGTSQVGSGYVMSRQVKSGHVKSVQVKSS